MTVWMALPSARPSSRMRRSAETCTARNDAFEETVVFLSYFKDLADPRQRGKISYPLDEILLLCLLAVLAGAETFVERCRPVPTLFRRLGRRTHRRCG